MSSCLAATSGGMVNTAPTRFLRRAAASLAIALLASPVAAQTAAYAPVTVTSFAKSEAILGGAPSRLAAILAQQSGMPAPVAATVSFEPASRRMFSPTPAVARYAPRVDEAVTSGRPDIFGSVALNVASTPLDGRWRRVERARVYGAAAAFAASLRARSEVERIEAINWYVNKRVRFVDDSRQYGRADVWTAANETLRRGRGDCEDYAIAKLQMLRAAGLADRNLYLVVLKDLVRRSDHAVLVVRSGRRMLVLDNGTDVVLDTSRIRDYRPIFTYASNGAWTHGYRRAMPPMTVASATIAPIAPAAAR